MGWRTDRGGDGGAIGDARTFEQAEPRTDTQTRGSSAGRSAREFDAFGLAGSGQDRYEAAVAEAYALLSPEVNPAGPTNYFWVGREASPEVQEL